MKTKILITTSLTLIFLLLFSLNISINIGKSNTNSKPLTIGFKDSFTITIGMVNQAYAATPDYTCDGIDDNVQFQAALDALPANGGKLHVLGGQYTFTSTVTRAIGNVIIEGVGYSTYFTYNGATALFICGGNNWVFQDIRFDAGGIDENGHTDVIYENVKIGSNAINYNFGSASLDIDTFTVSSGTITNLSVPGTLTAKTGRSSVITVAPYGSPWSSQTDVTLSSGDNSADWQGAVDLAITYGAGNLLVYPGTLTLNTAGVDIDPLLLKNTLKISGYGVSIDHNSADEAFDISTNLYNDGSGTVTYSYKNVIIEGFHIYGAATSTHGIKIANACNMIVDGCYIEGYIGGHGYLCTTDTTGYWSEFNKLFNSFVIGCKYPIDFDSDYDSFCDTGIYNVSFRGSGTEAGFKISGSRSPERSIFENIIGKSGVASATVFDFGSGDWESCNFSNVSVELNHNNCTAFTATANRHPYLDSTDIPLVAIGSGITGSVKFAGTMVDHYSTIYNDLIQNPHFTDAKVLLPLTGTSNGAWTRDISGNNINTNYLNSPNWSKQGSLGKFTLNGSTQYLKSDPISLSGSFSIVCYTAPDFDWNDNTTHYLWGWYVDANNLVSLMKDSSNQMWVVAKGGGQAINIPAGVCPHFTAGEQMIWVLTVDAISGTATLYCNAIRQASGTNALYNPGTTTANFYWGSNWTPAAYWGGDIASCIIVPRYYTDKDVVAVTRELSELLAINISTPIVLTETTLWNQGTNTASSGSIEFIVRDKGGKTELVAVFDSGTASVVIQP